MRQIVIEAETPDDSRTMFRLRVDETLIGERLTSAQAQIGVGEILESPSGNITRDCIAFST